MHVYMMNSYKPRSIVPEELPAVLSSLRDAGLSLGVISNRSKPFVEELVDLGLAPYFPYSLAGGEINAFKPQPAIFLHACKQTGRGSIRGRLRG